MLTEIARFEFRYLLRNPLLWVTAAATFAMFFAAMCVSGFELGSEGGLLVNASFALLRDYLMISMVFMFVTTSFVANVIIRDDETGFGPIVRSTPITKFEYLFGRFLGAFGVAALCMLVVPLAVVIGTMMPWVDPAQLGPSRLVDHLYAYFLIALPNLFIHAAILFALATFTRSMMATYLGVVGFASTFFLLQDSLVDSPRLRTAVALADPFASRALNNATRYWTIAERNVRLPDFAGLLLYNRLLWIAVAVLCLAAAYAAYRFAEPRVSKRQLRKQKLLERASAEEPSVAAAMSLPSPKHGSAAARALLWMRTRFEMKQVLLSPAFVILLAWGLYTTFFVLTTQRDPDGRPRYPITLLLIPKIEDAFAAMTAIVAIYYAGELVWRERDRKVHEIIDSAPMPNWAYVLPKTLAMALVLVSMLLTNVVASVILQLSLGFTRLELGKYLLWYVLPATWDMLLLAALAIFIQALSPHKVVGWAFMVLLMIWKLFNKAIDHDLLNYASTPGMPISDINGAGSFWKGAWELRLYWGAFAVLLLLAAHLLWRRGAEVRLKPRLAHALRRLGGVPGRIAFATLLVLIGTGAYAYYNINILNGYETPYARDENTAQYEKKYFKYLNLPQPTISDLELNIAVYPEQRRAVTTGRYLTRNLTSHPIPDVHVRLLDPGLELTRASVAGGRLIQNDAKFGYRIFHLDKPMQPGETRRVTFETRRWQRGFPNSQPNTTLIENGTFLSVADLMPVIGMNGMATLSDAATRRKHGLPPEQVPGPKLEDVSTTARPALGGEWTRSDITISTTASQTPIAPGRKVSDVTRDGRRTARFVSEAPIRVFFSAQSARYAEKHRQHAGVDLAVYYHRAHAWNVDRMLDALAAALDYYQANFGPYQFSHVRIVEFPGYRYFAQAFAGTIPYSETYGFISDYRKPQTLDGVTATTAHELAHQYWAHQVAGAATEGEPVLSETLANYSALMVIKKLYGEDHIRRFLQYQLDSYLAGRAYAPGKEPPLERVMDENWVTYRKGSLVMYLLQKRLGEDAVNRALRNLLHRYKFKGAPYPRSLDLIALLRAEAKTQEEQNLITDLFERVTLYDLKVTSPTAVLRADGKWDVTVPVEAKKLYVKGTSETEAPVDERIEVGLFTAEPGLEAFDTKDVMLMERHPIHSGRQVLQFVTATRPLFAGVDPYNFYIDRESADNVVGVK
jgi:ABC-2 type transport system permease protein